MLRAQIARRDAELEAHVLGREHDVLEDSRSDSMLLPKLSKDEAIAILARTSERNRALQMEVEELGKQVDTLSLALVILHI